MIRYKALKKQSIIEVIAFLFPDCSKNTLRSFFDSGRVHINGKKVSKLDTPLEKGEVVTVENRQKFFEENVRVLYEDQHLIAIEKPEGLLSVATLYDKNKTAHRIIKNALKKHVYPVHRLDRETSGVMVFALNEKAKEELKNQFEKHAITRKYIAVAHNQILQDEGTFQSFLQENKNYYVKSGKRGKVAITHYKVLKKNQECTLVAIQLETGRKNQIRVHFAENGFPILGDEKYGFQNDGANRLFLHAHKLGFAHPISKKPMQFISPVPEIFYKEAKSCLE
ncbi:MAG: RluA family pseudouridine synthase [Chlamydiae bacterium]|nr:RluA family pseudouridine synthase [Chlamydiota bacterium]